MSKKPDETFYDILKIDRRATIAEIVAAYHHARNAFSRDSVATYSLFTNEETQSILARLDEAYQTLSNLEKKAEYDRSLDRLAQEDAPPPPPEPPPAPPPEPPPAPSGIPLTDGEVRPLALAHVAASAAALPDYPALNGAALKEIRERRGMSPQDVTRITRIPMKFLLAIEGDHAPGLPARVYLQGFVKNLATLYRLDPKTSVEAYLKTVDAPRAPPVAERKSS